MGEERGSEMERRVERGGEGTKENIWRARGEAKERKIMKTKRE